jgi:tight adherence protein C
MTPAIVLVLELMVFLGGSSFAWFVMGIMVGRRRGRLGAAELPPRLIRPADDAPAWLLSLQDFLFRGGLRPSGGIRQDLDLAGFHHPLAPLAYLTIRTALIVGLPLLLLVFRPPAGASSTLGQSWAAPLALAALGLLGPWMVVTLRANARRAEVEAEFPDALDLLLLTMDGGLGLEGALLRVGREIRDSHPRVAALFIGACQEAGAGRDRAAALTAMADRSGVEAVASLVAMLNQSDGLGVSIRHIIRVYAADLRESRRLRAEEKAVRAPLLMTLPTVLLLLPVTIGLVMLPVFIDLVRRIAFLAHSVGPPAP